MFGNSTFVPCEWIMKLEEVQTGLFIFFLLLWFAASVQVVKAESVDQIHFPFGVTLFSPINKTYNSNLLPLNFSFAPGLGFHYSLSYDIDGIYEGPMPFAVSNPNEMHVVYHATGLVILPELSEGSHGLTVNLLVSPSTDHIKPSYSGTVYFSIDRSPPQITILSPASKIYTTPNATETTIPLDFSTDEIVSQITYKLDNQSDIGLSGNTTLTDLSLGSHNLTLSALDLAGNVGVSETINFDLEEEAEPQVISNTFPTKAATIISAAAVVTVILCLLIFLKKSPKSKVSQGPE